MGTGEPTSERGAFAVNFPGPGAVDSLSVYRQPGTHFAENALHFIRNGAVRARADVDEQIAIFADDIDELVDDKLRGFEAIVLDVAPGFVADGSVGLPVERANVL